LLQRTVDLLQAAALDVNVIDQRTVVAAATPLACKTVPWDWQETILQDCMKHGRGIVKAPTGSGKSIVMTNLIARINNPNTLILVNKRDILYQLKRDMKNDLGLEIGQIGDSVIDIRPITIAMIQTLANVYKIKVEGFEEKDKTKINHEKESAIKRIIMDTECLMADEVHNMVAKTYYSMQRYFKNAYFKFGFSATPYRTDQADLLLEAAFGPRVSELSCTELIDKGFLARPIFYLVKVKHNRAPREWNYQELYEKEVVLHEERNFAIVKLATKFWKENRRVLVIVNHRKHGEILENMLGITIGAKNVKYVHGDTDTGERQQALTDLNTGDIRMVVATKVWSEGINIKNLEVLINTKAQESPVDFVQIIGRAMRKAEGKDKVCIIDMYDHGCRYLEKHAKARLEVLKQEPAFELNEIDMEHI
jgi:superfamily II DNA or RNA helicase